LKEIDLREEDLVHRYTEEIRNYIVAGFVQKMTAGYDGAELRCLLPRKNESETALVILGGRTEFIEKYSELIFDLRSLDISIYSYDHRGQGLSQRALQDGHKGHVEDFGEYVEDLNIFLKDIVGNSYRYVFVLAHSMGGAVTAAFQLKYPGHLDGAILSAPMFGINCFPLSPTLAAWVAGSAIVFGFGERYIPGGSPYRDGAPFHENLFTSSKVRFKINQELIRSDPLVALGAPTNRWLKEALLVAETVVERAGELHIPILLLQSGADKVVSSRAQKLFCGRAAECQLRVIAGARHELLMERDSLRDQAIRLIIDFILEKGTNPGKPVNRPNSVKRRV